MIDMLISSAIRTFNSARFHLTKTLNAKTKKNCFEFTYQEYPPTSLVKISDPLRLSGFFLSCEQTEHLSVNESKGGG